MATRLKDTDVVIIGLGAAGGVAALPLAQAGLEVVGLEAGSWLTRRDYAPDEIRYFTRGWQQVSHTVGGEIPTTRPNARVQAIASAPSGPDTTPPMSSASMATVARAGCRAAGR